MADPAASRDNDLTVDVVWCAEDAATYARITTAAQATVIGSSERKWASAACALAGVVAGAGSFAMTNSALWTTLAAFAGILAVFAGQWSYFLDMRSVGGAERLFVGDPDAYPSRQVVLSKTHLSEISTGLLFQISLSRINRLSRAEGLLIIWISRADALAIPERCFETPATAGVFMEALAARMKAARSTG